MVKRTSNRKALRTQAKKAGRQERKSNLRSRCKGRSKTAPGVMAE